MYLNLKNKGVLLSHYLLLIILTFNAKANIPQITYENLSDIEIQISNTREKLIPLSPNEKSEKVYYLIIIDSLSMLYQQIGMQLWHRDPEDERRYLWFLQNTYHNTYSMHYWSNLQEGAEAYSKHSKRIHQYTAEIDMQLYNNNSNILEDMFIVYKNHFQGKRQFRNNIKNYYSNKLTEYLKLCQNTNFRPSKNVMLSTIKSIFLSAAKVDSFGISNQDGRIPYLKEYYRSLSIDFFPKIEEFGLTANDIIGFLLSFTNENNPILSGWQQHNINLFNSYQIPFPFEGETLKGNYININQFHGQVLLIDIWSLGCSSCISAFPTFNQLLTKYKSKGFNIISACMANKSAINKIEKIKSDMNLSWETVILSEINEEKSFSRKYVENYGFYGVPRYLLINREGKLVSYTIELEPDLEDKIKTLL